MAPHAHDDGFHEIQLNGKQLVFLFMAATVASVCIFLCGVFVGRGVRADRIGPAGDLAGLTTAASAEGIEAPRVTPPAPGDDPTKASPPPPLDGDLSYFDRLGKSGAPPEELKVAPPAAGSAQVRGSAALKARKPQAMLAQSTPTGKALKATDESSGSPAGEGAAAVAAAPPAPPPTRIPGGASDGRSGYTVQIAAMNVRGEADAMAKRLSERGYEAYVLEPLHGMPQVFRVRVGRFPTIHDAETVKTKLEKEEHFKPWITR